MGTYCTTTSLDTLMIGTTFDTATTSLGTKCITWSENEINKYISQRYNTSNFNTSTSIPPLITSLSEQLSMAYMYITMSRGGSDAQKRGYDLKKEVIENLKLIKDYQVNLLDTSGSALSEITNTAMQVKCNTTDYYNTFNEDDPLNWSIDQDKLDSIDSERD